MDVVVWVVVVRVAVVVVVVVVVVVAEVVVVVVVVHVLHRTLHLAAKILDAACSDGAASGPTAHIAILTGSQNGCSSTTPAHVLVVVVVVVVVVGVVLVVLVAVVVVVVVVVPVVDVIVVVVVVVVMVVVVVLVHGTLHMLGHSTFRFAKKSQRPANPAYVVAHVASSATP